jgi:very-short-patch-repair endonuclease
LILSYEKRLKPNARKLRGNMTDAEQKLWYRLRRKQINGWQFYRQKPLGPYIVDFYCAAAHLVVEIDGGQHFEPEHQREDQQRDAYLAGLGLRVLRFDNRQALLETDAVVEMIAECQIPPSPPFAKGGVGPVMDERPVASFNNEAAKQTVVIKTTDQQISLTEKKPPHNKGNDPVPPFAKGGLGGINTNPSTEDEVEQ